MSERLNLECHFCKKELSNYVALSSHERWCKNNPNRATPSKKKGLPVSDSESKPVSMPVGFFCQYCGGKVENRIVHEKECKENPVNIVKLQSSSAGKLPLADNAGTSDTLAVESAKTDKINSSANPVLEVAKAELNGNKKRDCSAILYILAILLIINIMLNALTLLGA